MLEVGSWKLEALFPPFLSLFHVLFSFSPSGVHLPVLVFGFDKFDSTQLARFTRLQAGPSQKLELFWRHSIYFVQSNGFELLDRHLDEGQALGLEHSKLQNSLGFATLLTENHLN